MFVGGGGPMKVNLEYVKSCKMKVNVSDSLVSCPKHQLHASWPDTVNSRMAFSKLPSSTFSFLICKTGY